MDTKRILSIGQCGADHAGIRWFVTSNFDNVEVDPAATEIEAFAALGKTSYDLVLVNRVLDRDHSQGLNIIRRLKGDERHANLPVMLVSNYPDARAKAELEGALPGFGKADLDDETLGKLRAALER